MPETEIYFDYTEYGEDWDGEVSRLSFLCSVIEGTCPGDRNFGLSQDIVDESIEDMETDYVMSLTEKMEIYTPLLELVSINFTCDIDGKICAKMAVEPSEESMEDDML